jgi:hypothetical protein
MSLHKSNPTTEKVVVFLYSNSTPLKRRTGCVVIISRNMIVLRSMDGVQLSLTATS